MIADKKRKILETEICENSLLIMVGKTEQIRNGDVFYPFRQDSDFLLLTGLDIPELVLIGIKKNNEFEWRLYSESITEKEKIWGTSRLPHESLRTLSGITEVREMRYFSSDIREQLREVDHIFLRDKLPYPEEKNLLRKFRLTQYYPKIQSFNPFLRPLRIYKTTEEIECIKKAVSITHQAYNLLVKNIRPRMHEYEIEALIAGVYRANATVESYPTIVASGPNSCIMHYVQHTRKLEHGDHILVDFGAEYRGYASDVTRVFFVDEPNIRQKEIYMSVMNVKNYAETLIQPGVKRLEYEKMVRDQMNLELEKLGLMPPGTQGKDRALLSRRYYPHSTSHFLGLDVHDTGERDDVFEVGMVITCEPGIYIREEEIGIRLEDDLLITESGYENLSREIALLDFL